MKKNLGTLLFYLLLFTGVYAQTEASFLKDAKTAENNKEYKQRNEFNLPLVISIAI